MKKKIRNLPVRENIRKRKPAREALRFEEHRYKSFTEYAPVGIFGTDVNGTTIYVNPRWCEISQISSDEALGNGWLNAVHPDDRKTISLKWQQAVSTQSVSKADYRFLHRDGSITWVSGEAVPQKDLNGNLTGYIGTITDITELKNHESALKEKEERYRTLFEGANDAIFIMDNDRFSECNEMTLLIFGCKRKDEIIGHHPWEFSPEIQPDGTRSDEKAAFLIKSALDGIPQRFYWKHCKMNGDLIDTEVSLSRIIFDKSVVIQALVRDISKSKKAEEELMREKERAEESDRLKTAFLHNISHEIRTPLNAIIGFSTLLDQPDIRDEEKRSYLEIIFQSNNQLLSIINDVLNISYIEAGQERINNSVFDLNHTMNNLYNQFLPDARKKAIIFKFEPGTAGKPFPVITDENKTIQILANLLNNAIKFTNQGYVRFGYRTEPDMLIFFVEDTGIGIPEKEQSRIFERFYQVDSKVSRRYGGTGLGLAISTAYTLLLGGELTVSSEVGKGSLFTLSLPLRIADLPGQKKVAIPVTENKEARNKRKILIAEDEESNYALLEAILVPSSYDLIHARNGREAIDLCKSDPGIDLILMDIKLPDIDGFEATNEIRKFRPGVPVIAQTAFAHLSDRNKALESGCNDYLAKPYNKGQLLSLIEKYLK